MTSSGSELSWSERARWSSRHFQVKLYSDSSHSAVMTASSTTTSLRSDGRAWSSFSTKWLVTPWPRTSDACTCFYRRTPWTATTPHPKSDKPRPRPGLDPQQQMQPKAPTAPGFSYQTTQKHFKFYLRPKYWSPLPLLCLIDMFFSLSRQECPTQLWCKLFIVSLCLKMPLMDILSIYHLSVLSHFYSYIIFCVYAELLSALSHTGMF